MRTVLSVLVVVAIIAAAAFGLFPWAKTYLQQSQQDINQSFADKVRSAKLPELAQQIILKKTGEVQEHLAAIMQAKNQLKPMQEKVDGLKAQVKAHEEAMNVAWQAMDASQDPTLTINGKSIARADVIADVNRRTAECEKLRLKLEPAEASCIMLTKAVNDGEQKILEAKRILDDRKSELDSIKITLEAGDALAAVRQLTDQLANGPDVAVEEDPVFKEIRKRLAEADAVGVYEGLTATADFIDYGNGPEKDSAPKDAAMAYRQKHLGVAPEVAPALSAEPAK